MIKTVLFLGGGVDSLGIIRRAKEMGLRTIVLDSDPNAPARNGLANVFSEASCYEGWDALSAAATLVEYGERINAVLCAGTDAPHNMAALARKYNLVGPSQRCADLSRNKWAQATVLQEAGVRIPKFWAVTPADVPSVAGTNMVIKPVDSRGARGVMRLRAGDELTRARYEESAKHSHLAHVMGQAWIDGVQLSSESLVQDGRILWTGFAERNYNRLDEFAPYVIEDGGQTPPSIVAYFENDYQAKAEEQLRLCANAMGLRYGTLKGDLVWDGHDIHVIEVACRLSGGSLCSEILPEVWGVDFVGMAIRIALGDYIWPGEIRPYLRRYACQRFLFPKRPTSHPERGAGVIGYGPTPQQAEEHAAKRLREML